MFAVIKTGGKQYRVEPGTVLNIEKIEANIGDAVEVNDVLLYANGSDVKIGQPLVTGVKVSLEVLSHVKGPKLRIFKKIRRHGKQLRKGHRQNLTRVKVAKISA